MVAGNVCEAVVRPRYQAVADTLDWLGQWGVARMTGTGAACFAAPDDVAIAAALAARSVPCPVMRVRGLNLSPALRALPPRVS